MNGYQRFLLPLLQRMDAEKAHDRVLALLRQAQGSGPGRAFLTSMAGRIPDRPVRAFGLTFPNPLGMAAGFDKNALVAEALALLGFGHVEVGTLTPRPQEGNPKPRVFRLPQDRALINRMGFPNGGVQAALPRLRALSARSLRFVLGVSLGKQKPTPLTEALGDYVAVMRDVYPFAGYLAVNVSSPNTPELRSLQFGRHLEELLAGLAAESRRLAPPGASPKPLLLKVAPDVSPEELDEILEASLRNGISGIIATNTTVSREGLVSATREETGGLSGGPLAARSTEVVRHIARYAGGALPVIGVGGIFSAADAQEKLDAGAVLVQAYTGMVYEGPGFAGRLLRGLRTTAMAHSSGRPDRAVAEPRPDAG